MPIFGARDLFGRSRFGQANYGELSLYELLPAVHRVLDAEQGEPLKKLLTAFQEEMEDVRRQIDLLPFQRDPYLATGLDYPESMLLVAAQNTGNGVQITVDVDHDLTSVSEVDILGAPNDQLEGRYRVKRVLDSRNFVLDTNDLGDVAGVQGAHLSKVSDNACLVEIESIDVYEDTWGDSKKTLSKITITNKSAAEKIGVGYYGILKAYLPVPPPENAYIKPSQALYRVLYVRRRDQTVGSKVEVICEGGLRLEDIEGDLPNRLIMRFLRPSSLALLANDYGLVTDENLPDVFQRTEIANVYQFLRLKSSRAAYEARSRGGGFRVSVTQLFKLCEDSLGRVPEANVYIGETGAGNMAYYSDINIVRPLYDDVSADLTTPSGVPFTDITLFAAPELTTFNQDIDAFIQCLFKVVCVKAVLIDEEYARFGRSAPFYMCDFLIPDYPANGWQVATVENGSFALVDSEGYEYFISETEQNNRFDMTTTVYLDAQNIFFGEGDELCVAYRPSQTLDDCCLCPSSEIMIEIEALPAFINQSGYSGEALADAYVRILSRIKREQVPIHVHVSIETLVVNVLVEVPTFEVEPLVSIEIDEIIVDFEGEARYDCRYDDIPADEIPTDTCSEVLSYPGVLIEVINEPLPEDQITFGVSVEAPQPEVAITEIDVGVVRDILVSGSSHYDDTPADDIETDNDLVGFEPKVTVVVE